MSLVHDGGLPRPVRLASALSAAGAALAALGTGEALLALRHVGQATDAFRRVADPDTVTAVLDALHSTLYYDIGAGIILVLLLIPLSRILRQPSQRIRMSAWVVVAVAWAVLGCGLATDDDRAAPAGNEEAEVLRAWSSLSPESFPIAHSLTVLALLATLTTVAPLLARSSVQDFYRQRHQDGPAGLWSYARPRDDTPR